MEEDTNTDGKRKITPSIPENYISIRHLQERWINEKDRKRKEEEEKRGNQQAEKQRTIEDDLKKTEEARGEPVEEKRLIRSNRKNWGRHSRKKELMNGGDAKFTEKEELEVTAAIGSERSEEAAAPKKKKKNKGSRRKRYPNKKKENQDVAVVEDVVVDCETGSIAPPPEVVATEKITPVKDVNRVYRKKGEKATGKKHVEYLEKNQDVAVVEDVVVAPPEVVVTEKITPVKDVIGVYRKKGRKATGKKSVEYLEKNQDVAVVEDVVVAPPEVVVTEKITPVKDVIGVYRKKGRKSTGKKSVEYLEKAVTDDVATAIETRFEDLSIKNGETKNLKAETRPSNRNRLNQGNDLVHQRVRMPRGAAASTMVWVKKEQSQRAGDGIANGVKPLNA